MFYSVLHLSFFQFVQISQYKYYFRFVIQGTALVHIYLDGTVFLATGSMELGQGLNTKMIQVRFTKRFPHLMKNECQFLPYLLSCCFNEKLVMPCWYYFHQGSQQGTGYTNGFDTHNRNCDVCNTKRFDNSGKYWL